MIVNLSNFVTPMCERPLFPGLYLIIIYNYKTIIVSNNSLNSAHPIAVAQVKPQPKDQMRVVLTFKLTAICRPKHACITWGLTRYCSTHTCLTWSIRRHRTHPSYIASITLLAYSPASCCSSNRFSTVFGSFHKLGLTFRTYFDLKLQRYITLYVEVQFIYF